MSEVSSFSKKAVAVFLNFAFILNQVYAQMPPEWQAAPSWWSDSTAPVIDPGIEEPGNHGVANIGQAKWMVLQALRALDTSSPAVAASIRADLMGTSPANRLVDFAVPSPITPEWSALQRSPLLLGQLKALATPFYARLNGVAPTWLNRASVTDSEKGQLQLNGTKEPGAGAADHYFPWTKSRSDDRNRDVATVGQLKAVFSLRFDTMPTTDTDGDGMTDQWELANGSDPNVYDRDAIKPGTTISFYEHYLASLELGVSGNSSPPLPTVAVPALTIDTEAPHTAVTGLKGSLSVGADGSASYAIPIDLPKGTAGMEPKLNLGYSSNSGNGFLGVGWSLGGLQRITRGPSSAAKDGVYDPMDFDLTSGVTKDRFFLDGERLICVSGNYGVADSVYRTEMDSYARITAYGTGPAYWKVETKAGLIVTLGNTADSKLAVISGTLGWCVDKVADTKGNYYKVEYARDTETTTYDFRNHRVSAIRYTGNDNISQLPYCSVNFEYETRPDISRAFTTWSGSYASKRMSKIVVKTDNYVNHSYRFSYNTSYQSERSFLYSVTKCMNDDLSKLVLPTYFNYDGLQQPSGSGNPLWVASSTISVPPLSDADGKDQGVTFVDLNSDGLTDIANWRPTDYLRNSDNSVDAVTTGTTRRNTGNGFVTDNDIRPPASMPLGVRTTDGDGYDYNEKHRLLAQPMDIDGDGNLDLLAPVNLKTNSGETFLRNGYAFYSLVGGAWVEKSAWRLPFYMTNDSSSSSNGGRRRDEHFQWTDLNGDGYQDLVVHTTSYGRIYDRFTDVEMIGNSAGTAFLNGGADGAGWVRTHAYRLPLPLLEDGKDIGLRLVDLNNDGLPELSKSRYDGGDGLFQRTYFLMKSGSMRWLNNPDNDTPHDRPYDLPIALLLSNDSPTGAVLVDLNGDGMVDVLNAKNPEGDDPFSNPTWINEGSRGLTPWNSEPSTINLNSGFNADNYRLSYPLNFSKDGYNVSAGYEMADLNGDGLVDILYSDIDNDDAPDGRNLAILNTGSGWRAQSSWGLPGSNRIFTTTAEREAGKRRSKLQDLNGDGFPDLITGLLTTTPQVWVNQCRPEVLTSVTDGLASRLHVQYKRLNDPTPVTGFGTRVYEKNYGTLPAGHASIIDARLVVSAYSEPDGSGGYTLSSARWRYQRYGDLRYDRYNESSLGFGWMEVRDSLNGQMTRTETSRTYPHGGSPVLTKTWVNVTTADLKPALVAGGVTAGSKCVSEVSATYGELATQSGTGGVVRRPVQTGSVKTVYDLAGVMVSRSTTAQSLANFDAYGFVKNSTVTALDGTSMNTVCTYDNTVDSTRWHLGRLRTSTVTKSGGGMPTTIRSSAFTYDATSGLLESETIEPNNAAFKSTKTYTRNDYGDIRRTENSANGITTRTNTSTYDARGRFMISGTNQLGHTMSYGYNFQKAVLDSTTDITGKTTGFGYDDYGTITRTYHPDGTVTGESTGYYVANMVPPTVTTYLTSGIRCFRAKQTSGNPLTKAYLDPQGRELVSETTILRNAAATDGSRYSKIYTVARYDLLGRKVAVSKPFAAGEVPELTSIEYDVLGRVLKTTHPDGSADYVEAFATQNDPGGKPVSYSKTISRDGKFLQRWENQHGRLSYSYDPSGLYTEFFYDQEGRTLSVKVGGQELLINTFDQLGNKNSVWEINSGSSSSVFNAFGEITSSTNAKGKTTLYFYDIYGRPETVQKPDAEGTFQTYYNSPDASALGKPWRITGPDSYEEKITFDGLGRPVKTTITQRTPGQGIATFTTTTATYDALGRLQTEKDAGGLTIVHDYDATYSFPLKLSIGFGSAGYGKVLWQAGTYNSQGKPLTQTLAQEVTSTSTYQANTGLLNTLAAVQGGTPLQQKTYAWDTLGNLSTRTDDLSGKKEFFKYDGLNRVTHAHVDAASVATYTFSGPQDFGYSANGNLTSKSGSSLSYAGTRPHAVSSATVKGALRSYVYDDAGYVTSDGKRTYEWTSYGQVSALDYAGAPAVQDFNGIQIFAGARVETDFTFNASGNRAAQLRARIAADGSSLLEETLYLGGYEREIHSSKANSGASPVVTKTVHRHNIGGFAVYSRTVKPSLPVETKLTTILKDHLGSTDVLYTGTWNGSNFTSPVTENQSFDPWGERRSPATLASYRTTDSDAFRTSSQNYDRGYTGHEHLDDSGIVHMNGRLYDPELGRMLSPDPYVQIPEYSQNFNRYSYVLNNPLNMTDPSGFSWLSNIFHKVGSWLKENWRTVVLVVVVAVVTWGVGAMLAAGATSTLSSTTFAYMTVNGSAALTTAGMATAGAIGGAVGGGLGAAFNGGDLGDVLRGAAIGAVQGAITGGMADGVATAATAGNYGLAAARIAGHGVVGGAVNSALGGKFQDGFVSAAAGAASQLVPYGNASGFAGTIKAGVVGGTASQLGGGKFANGAYTAAFQYIVSVGLGSIGKGKAVGDYTAEEQLGIDAAKDAYNDDATGMLKRMAPKYSQAWGLSATMSGNAQDGYIVAFRGTQLLSLADWYNNVLQAFGIPTPQYAMAKYIGRAVYDQTHGNVTFVGHSLGGGLASAAGMVTGARVITINAAGLHPWTASGGSPDVTAHFIKGDILSFIQDNSPLPNAYGRRGGFDPPGLATPFGYHSSNWF